MNRPCPTADPTFDFHAGDDGIFDIQPRGQFVPELSQAIVQQVKNTVDDGLSPAGILLDMSRSDNLSLVRLSHLIDLLTEYPIPVAVLFGTDAQLQLAVLLHNTLNNHKQVAYFTERSPAQTYLRTGQLSHSSKKGC
jgi:hypothetical protein